MTNKTNIKIYHQSIKKNILGVKSILKKLRMKKLPLSLYENVLTQTSDQIISNWATGRKYSRTLFAQNAFGKWYPIKYTQLSLCIDTMVNILDDFLDEVLDKKTRVNYIIEFLRIFSTYESECPLKIHRSLKEYFEKLITLAVAEGFYQKQIAQEKDLNKIVKDSADLLICRGQDIDVFIEIALLNFKNRKAIPVIKKIGRIFRALNILKKDIKDIEHDQKNKIDTVVTLIFSRDDINFSVYIGNLLNFFIERVNLILKPISTEKKDSRFLPIYNFNQMIQKDKKEILKIIQSL